MSSQTMDGWMNTVLEHLGVRESRPDAGGAQGGGDRPAEGPMTEDQLLAQARRDSDGFRNSIGQKYPRLDRRMLVVNEVLQLQRTPDLDLAFIDQVANGNDPNRWVADALRQSRDYAAFADRLDSLATVARNSTRQIQRDVGDSGRGLSESIVMLKDRWLPARQRDSRSLYSMCLR